MLINRSFIYIDNKITDCNFKQNFIIKSYLNISLYLDQYEINFGCNFLTKINFFIKLKQKLIVNFNLLI